MRREPVWEALLYLGALLFFLRGYGVPFASAPPYEPGVRAAHVVRIATWNVGGASGGANHALRAEHVDHVAGVLRALDPDVVVLQEVGSHSSFRRLRDALGGGWDAAYESGGGLGAFARRGELRHFRTPDGLERSIHLTYEPGGDRSPLVLMGVHAHVFDAERRNREIGRAVDALAQRVAGWGCVLLGDLNLDVDLDTKRDLFTNREHLDVETYNYVAQRFADAATGRGSTAEPDRRLDYVFVSEELEVVKAGPWKGQRVGSMDHDPVVAEVRLR